MKLLILYATIEGQTAKIARYIEQELQAAGHETAMVDIGDHAAQVSFDGIDKVVLAAPVHERRHPEAFEVFVTASKATLQKPDTLMLSVSMSAAFPEGQKEARDYVLEMEMRTGFKPTQEMLVAGAIRLNQYDYYASQVLQHVVMRDRDYDKAASEHEFTDWDALSKGLAAFLAVTV